MTGEELTKAIGKGAAKKYELVLEPPGAHLGNSTGPLWVVIGARKDAKNGRMVLELDEIQQEKKGA